MPSKPLLSSSPPRIRTRTLRECGRSALDRIVELHRRLSHNETVTTESIALELGVTSRTIKRDIELMRDRLGVPIVWDPAGHTYIYDRHCDLLPLLRIEADEALALALAGRTFAAWRGSSLAIISTLNQGRPR